MTIVTLTTDFGTRDTYAGAMKGVVLGINPQAALVDLSHHVSPQGIPEGAFLLKSGYASFPEGTVHVVVVDPGVGTDRRAVALEARGHVFVAPDNGVLSYIVEEALGPNPGSFPRPTSRSLGPGVRAVALTRAQFWRHPVSSTFHGRDIFAPVAAHLSLGRPLADVGEPISDVLAFPFPQPERDVRGRWEGQVVYVDGFGNLTTSFREEDLPAGRVAVEISGRRIEGLSRSYASGGPFLALIGSAGYLEIAASMGNAAQDLGVGVGARVTVLPLSG